MGIICYGISIAICAVWFFFKHHPLAFLLLNFINVAICAFFIKYLTFERLKRHLELRVSSMGEGEDVAIQREEGERLERARGNNEDERLNRKGRRERLVREGEIAAE